MNFGDSEPELFAEDESTIFSFKSPPKKRRKAYTAEFKLEVINHAKKTSNHQAESHFKVSRTQVIEWKKKESELCALV